MMKKKLFSVFLIVTLLFVSCDFGYSYGGYLFFDSGEDLIFAGFDVKDSEKLSIKTLEIPTKFYGKNVVAIGNHNDELSDEWCSLQGLTRNVGYYHLYDPSSKYYYNYINYISTIVIPSNIRTIYYNAFSYCLNLESVYVHSTNPPKGNGSIPINSKLKIYVPAESIDLYKNHESWKTYKDYIFAME